MTSEQMQHCELVLFVILLRLCVVMTCPEHMSSIFMRCQFEETPVVFLIGRVMMSFIWMLILEYICYAFIVHKQCVAVKVIIIGNIPHNIFSHHCF